MIDTPPAELSVEVLAGAMLMGGFEGTSAPDELLDLVRQRHLGGIVLFTRNYESPQQVRYLVDSVRAAAATPDSLIVAVDHEGGPVQRFREPFTRIPAMARLGEKGDEGLAHKVGRIIAQELLEVGVNLDFAPVMDVNTNPDNPIIGERAISSDPERVARLGAAIILGMQSRGVAACAKHFPGHGDTTLDSHLALPRVDRPKRRLKRIELLPFLRASKAGAASVMVGHLLFPTLDPERPATLSRPIIAGTLRRDLKYDGVVITDDLEMAPIADGVGIAEATRQGLAAGIDLFLVCHRRDRQELVLDTILESVRSGAVSRERLEESYARLARLKRSFPPPEGEFNLRLLGQPVHARLAEQLV